MSKRDLEQFAKSTTGRGCPNPKAVHAARWAVKRIRILEQKLKKLKREHGD